MSPENQDSEAPAHGYLTLAGIPAGLLLALGSWYILKQVGENNLYRREAPGTLLALQGLQWIGFVVAGFSVFLLVLNLIRGKRL